MTLLYVGLAWLVGIALAIWLQPPLPVLGALAVPALAGLLLWWREPLPRRLAVCTLALLAGGVRTALAAPQFGPGDLAFYNDHPTPVTVVGVVDNYPDVRDTYQNLRVRAESLTVTDSHALSQPIPVEGSLLVQAARYPARAYGDRLRSTGRLLTPTENPEFSYRDELAATASHAGVVGTYQGFDAYRDIVPQWAYIEVAENGKWVPVVLGAEVYPTQGGTVSLGNTLGQTTTIEIPPGATAQTLVFTYTLVATATNAGVPTMTMMGRHAIRLETNVAPSGRMTMTIQYEDGDVSNIDETTLALYTWDGSQWIDAQPCGGYIRDVDNNVLRIILCHFSDYVLLGEMKPHHQWLPVVMGSGDLAAPVVVGTNPADGSTNVVRSNTPSNWARKCPDLGGHLMVWH